MFEILIGIYLSAVLIIYCGVMLAGNLNAKEDRIREQHILNIYRGIE